MSESSPIYTNPSLRHDFLFLFDVTDGNPNGDPDAGNMPRIDPETAHGLVTDVCLKRKIRNYIYLVQENASGYGIYVNDKGVALNTLHDEAYKNVNIPAVSSDTGSELTATGTKQARDVIEIARQRMCRRFFDVRLFGAVMSTGRNAGQVRGPVQLTFSRSVDPIASLEVAITRVAITKPEDMEVKLNPKTGETEGGKRTEFGRKALVPYGLYVAKGFFSPSFAKQTGVTSDDLTLLWDALQNMFDVDRSAARGLMSCRGLYVFTHADERGLGNAPAHKLFDTLKIQRKAEVESPRRYEDYQVTAPVQSALPAGITLSALVEG